MGWGRVERVGVVVRGLVGFDEEKLRVGYNVRNKGLKDLKLR